MSSGLLDKNGVFALDNPSFVQGFYESLQCTKQEMIKKAKKQQKIIDSNINKVKTACNKHWHESEHMFQKFNLSKGAAYLQYECHEKDAAIPMSVGKRRKNCMELMQCKSPTSSPHTSNVNNDGAGAPSPDLDALDGLMGLSSSTKKYRCLWICSLVENCCYLFCW